LSFKIFIKLSDKMTRVQNHRANVKAGITKHKKSLARRLKDKEFFREKEDKKTYKDIKNQLRSMRERDRINKEKWELTEENDELWGN